MGFAVTTSLLMSLVSIEVSLSDSSEHIDKPGGILGDHGSCGSERRESRSRPGLETKGWNLSRLGLVSDGNFWCSLVPVSSRWFNFHLVSSRSRPDLDE